MIKTQSPFKHKRLREVEEEIAQLRARTEKLSNALQKEQRRIKIRCTDNRFGKGCGNSAQLRNVTYIQTHRYIPPRGCTDGDYWKADEGHFLCPHCNHRNTLYDRPEYCDLVLAFGKYIAEYNNDVR